MTQTNVNTGGSGQAAYGRDGSVTGSVNLRSSHTIACRVRHTSTATTYDSVLVGYSIVSGGNDNGSFISRFNGDPSTQLAFYRWDGASTFDTVRVSGAYGSTTAWVHVALVYDGTNITPYVNGVAGSTVASVTTRTTSTTSVRLWAGGPHPGEFADAVFFGRALTAAEVLALSNQRNPDDLARGDLIAFYPEFSDTVTIDLSNNANTLSVIHSGTGTSPTATNGAPPTAWVSRQPYRFLSRSYAAVATGTTNSTGAAVVTSGSSAAASGSTQCTGTATLTSSSSLVATGTTQVSGAADLPSALRTSSGAGVNAQYWASCWVFPRSSVAASEAVYARTGITNSGVFRIALNGTTLRFEVTNPAQGSSYVYQTTLTIGAWVHVALAMDTTCSSYINGVLVDSASFDSTGITVMTNIDMQRNGDMTLRDVVLTAGTLSAARAQLLSAQRFQPVFFGIYFPLLEGGSRLLNWSMFATTTLNVLGTVVEGSENPPAPWSGPNALRFLSSAAIALTASGSTQTTGTAVLTSSSAIVATGTTNTTGSAASTETASLVAAGSVQTTGSAAVSFAQTIAISATGSVQTSGAASTSSAASLVASGSTQTTGAAAIAAAASLAANGTTQVTGTANVLPAGSIPASGTTQVNGTAVVTLAQVFQISATGTTNVSGAVSIGVAYAITASGLTQVSGAAAVTQGSAPAAGGDGAQTGGQRRWSEAGGMRRRTRR